MAGLKTDTGRVMFQYFSGVVRWYCVADFIRITGKGLPGRITGNPMIWSSLDRHWGCRLRYLVFNDHRFFERRYLVLHSVAIPFDEDGIRMV